MLPISGAPEQECHLETTADDLANCVYLYLQTQFAGYFNRTVTLNKPAETGQLTFKNSKLPNANTASA